MQKKNILVWAAAVAYYVVIGTAIADTRSPAKQLPNIVILLADDLGFNDVSYHGGKVRTPHIDRLAEQGVRLEKFYSCPVCSPTRSGLMTGRWPIRLGLMRTVVPPWSTYGLPTDEETLADMLAKAGYRRRGIVGKWHLGHADTKYHPLSRGFTHFYGHYNGAIDYFTHVREGEVDWHRNMKTLFEKGYTTDLLGREAVRFIQQSPADEPFFLYVPFNAPHSPFQAKEEDLKKYPDMKRIRRKTYAAMVDSMDQAIGKILAALERRGLVDNTLVLFFSDNGGVRGVADNSPLRAGKTTVYEGGVRVPAVVRWPKGNIAGGKTVGQRMGYIDIFPTLKKMVGLSEPSAKPLDGINMLDVWRGGSDKDDRDWFSFISMTKPEFIAVNTGQWKLVVSGPSVLELPSAENARVELFRIDRDPQEKTDVAKENPQVVAQLTVKLKKFRALKINGVQPYKSNRENFKAPKDWVITP